MNEKMSRIVVQLDPDLQDLIPGFLENRRKDLETIQTALSQGDFQTIVVLGHTMKGDGGGYGFEAISDIGGGLETAAKQKDMGRVQKELIRLADFLDRVEITYP